MLGYVTYLIIVALPAYLAARFIHPFWSWAWIILLLIASIYRYLEEKDNETERKAFWYLALPVYVFSAAMLLAWF